MYIILTFSLLFLAQTYCMEDISIGTAGSKHATKVMFLGAGELGKGVVQEFQKLGVEVIAVDRYDNAPGMQVAHRFHVGKMLDRDFLADIIKEENPTYIVPEIEAINTDYLMELEKEGKVQVIPTAKATWITMNRKRIRSLAAEKLEIPTSRYKFADSKNEFKKAVQQIGYPCVTKPNMSSSGKGQSVLKSDDDIDNAWEHARTGARGEKSGVIVEEFVDFDYEITQLTVRHKNGTSFCEPIGHIQKDGDYRESWQPHPMSNTVKRKVQEISKKVTDALGGRGVFGVELFVKGDEILFSEVSPRPHDTGMVTFISQEPNEFALHARAILGLPIPKIAQRGPSASCALLVKGDSDDIEYGNLGEALAEEDTDVHFFGKPEVHGERRMGVTLARGKDIEEARAKARKVAKLIKVKCN